MEWMPYVATLLHIPISHIYDLLNNDFYTVSHSNKTLQPRDPSPFTFILTQNMVFGKPLSSLPSSRPHLPRLPACKDHQEPQRDNQRRPNLFRKEALCVCGSEPRAQLVQHRMKNKNPTASDCRFIKASIRFYG